MENDSLDHWTDEDERAFQEYCRANPDAFVEHRRPVRWIIRRFNRLPLPDSEDALDDLLRAAFE